MGGTPRSRSVDSPHPGSPGGDRASDDRSGETAKERVDRELIELLNELRVALPGMQVLFAFLLVLPFQVRFTELSNLERGLYFLAFLATATGSILLIAPTTYHRIRFRSRDKEHMVRTFNKLLLAGTGLLGVAISAVTYLVTDVVFGDRLGLASATIVGGLIAALWFAIPVRRNLREGGASFGGQPEEASQADRSADSQTG